MILVLLEVVLPVFLVIGAGYVARATLFMPDAGLDGLNIFAQRFAIPCLLFEAVRRLDLASFADWQLLASFYAGTLSCFVLGVIGARVLFGRRPGEAIAIGFSAMFANSVILGLPITERAYGTDALAANYAIVAIHAPICYFVGIAAMEAARADGVGIWPTLRAISRNVLQNALMIGLALGFLANIFEFLPPPVLQDALDMMIRAALPVALFGLGGVLARYKMRDKLGEAGMIAGISLILHPGITWVLATQAFDLPVEITRSAVLTASMAPGVNGYIFALMYNRAMGTNSTAVMLGTLLSVLTVPVWLAILG